MIDLDHLPATITIKLYPVEYAFLWGYMQKNQQNIQILGLNAHIGDLILQDFYKRKIFTIRKNSFSSSKNPRRLTMKPHEAKALYDGLKLEESPLATIIFGHLDRALINAGFNNKLNQ